MKNIIYATLLLLAFVGIAKANDFNRMEGEIHSNANSMAEACVSIKSAKGAWGSGVLVNNSGMIFSAAHVYQNVGETVTVFFNAGEKASAKVVKLDEKHDIAVLNLFSKVSIAPAKVAAQRVIEDGKTLVAAGHASGYNKERKSPLRVGFGFLEQRRGMIYTTCRITAGDSGGPLYDENGMVRGVHHTMDGSGKYSAHVPVERFFQIWPELVQAVTLG